MTLKNYTTEKLKCLQEEKAAMMIWAAHMLSKLWWKCSAYTLHKVSVVARVVGFPELKVIPGIDEVG